MPDLALNSREGAVLPRPGAMTPGSSGTRRVGAFPMVTVICAFRPTVPIWTFWLPRTLCRVMSRDPSSLPRPGPFLDLCLPGFRSLDCTRGDVHG